MKKRKLWIPIVAVLLAAAAAAHMASAFSWLMGQQALALPLFATTPQATPSSRCSIVT